MECRVRWIFTSACLAFSLEGYSQELISAAGASFKNSSYVLEWSLGELQTESLSAGEGILSQGLHQPVVLILGIGESTNSIAAYPNPTGSLLTFTFQGLEFAGGPHAHINVVDSHGVNILSTQIRISDPTIDLSRFSPGIYLLTLQLADGQQKHFKVIKL